jgi:hypothetical protein
MKPQGSAILQIYGIGTKYVNTNTDRSALLHTDFQTRSSYSFLVSTNHATYSAHLVFLFYHHYNTRQRACLQNKMVYIQAKKDADTIPKLATKSQYDC